MAKIEGIRPPFVPPGGLEKSSRPQPIITSDGKRFDEILLDKLEQLEERTGVKFSSHAQSRLNSRNIELSPKDLDNLADAIDRAEAKGAKETLVLLRDNAFLVNVKNRTVITAVDDESIEENVFTNIDSAVVVKNKEESTENQIWFE